MSVNGRGERDLLRLFPDSGTGNIFRLVPDSGTSVVRLAPPAKKMMENSEGGMNIN